MSSTGDDGTRTSGQGGSNSSNVNAVATNLHAEQIVRSLSSRLKSRDGNWRVVLFETMAEWPFAEETLEDRRCVYLIDGEAFDWRALADRLLSGCDSFVSPEQREALIMGPDPPGGFSEDEFRRFLGVEKYRGHLNYLYGVTVEQALIVATEEEIRKRQVGNCYEPSDDRVGQAYVNLYRATREDLWRHYRLDTGGAGEEGAAANPMRKPSKTLAEDDAFTYWLFKRRFKMSEPARLASDTRKALEQLERMRAAHHRRVAILRRDGSQGE